MIGEDLLLAITLLPALSRCQCSALPECRQTYTFKLNYWPFSAHTYLTMVYSFLAWESREAGTDFFLVTSDRT